MASPQLEPQLHDSSTINDDCSTTSDEEGEIGWDFEDEKGILWF